MKLQAKSLRAACLRFTALGLAAAVAGCASDGLDLPEAQCSAAGAAAQLGKQLDERTVDIARAEAGAMRDRIVRPGQVISTDFDPQRLNIEVDDTNRIRRLRCG